MMVLIRMELDKALKNKWFVIALGVGCVLGLMAAIPYGIALLTSTFSPAPNKFYDPELQSCFNAWMSIDQSAESLLFFQIVPLLAVIPYAWSLCSERKDGYLAQVYSRTKRGGYLVAKGIAVFCAAGLVAVVPQILNLIVVACFLPGYTPQVGAAIYTAVFWDNVGSWFFYNIPLLHAALFWGIDFLLCGIWAAFVFALSCLVRNRVVLLTAPYLALLMIQFVNDRIFLALGALSGFDVGLFNNLRASLTSHNAQDGWVMSFEMLILLMATWVIGWVCRKRDVL